MTQPLWNSARLGGNASALFSAMVLLRVLLLIAAPFAVTVAHAQDTICARVKIEIKQELTLERQAFDAQMKPSLVGCASRTLNRARMRY